MGSVLVSMSDPEAAALGQEVLQLYETAARDMAETVVESGKRLQQLRALVAPASWTAWVEDEAPFSVRAAANYLRLAAFAAEAPRDFLRWKHLGPTKLYALMGLSWASRRVLRQRKLHAVPGAGKRTLERMSAAQLHLVVAALEPTPVPAAATRTLTSARRRARGLARVAATLAEMGDAVDRDEARGAPGPARPSGQPARRGVLARVAAPRATGSPRPGG